MTTASSSPERLPRGFRRWANSWAGTGGEGSAALTGLRRVDWVRMFVDAEDRRVRAEVSGVGFRLPVARTVPLSVAAELIASGTPCVTYRSDGGR